MFRGVVYGAEPYEVAVHNEVERVDRLPAWCRLLSLELGEHVLDAVHARERKRCLSHRDERHREAGYEASRENLCAEERLERFDTGGVIGVPIGHLGGQTQSLQKVVSDGFSSALKAPQPNRPPESATIAMMAPVARPAPPATTKAVRRRMQATPRRDTKPEMTLRSELHRLGLRYFVHRRPVRGLRREADLVFPRSRVAVFVDSCFWHGCPEHVTWPTAHAEWWREKIERTRSRDRDTDVQLVAAGWEPIRVWEHESSTDAAQRILLRVRRRNHV